MAMRSAFRPTLAAAALATALLTGCKETSSDGDSERSALREEGGEQGALVTRLLVLDEDAFSPGPFTSRFTDRDLNRGHASLANRSVLPFFARSVGKEILLPTGRSGDEGWFAIASVRASWNQAGPEKGDGLRNFLEAGPGLGSPDAKGRADALLKKVPGLIPLRAMGLSLLEGSTVCAVVLEGDARLTWSPRSGDLSSPALGIAAFKVLESKPGRRGSRDALPPVRLRVLNAQAVCNDPLVAFREAPSFKRSCAIKAPSGDCEGGLRSLVLESWNTFDSTRWSGDGDEAVIDGLFMAREGAFSAAADLRLASPLPVGANTPVRFSNRLRFVSPGESDSFESGALFLVSADTGRNFRDYAFLNVGYASGPGSRVFVEMFGASGGVDFDQLEESSLAFESWLEFDLDLIIQPKAFMTAVNGEMVDTVRLAGTLAQIGLFEVGVQRHPGGLQGFLDSTGISQQCQRESGHLPRAHPSCKRKHRSHRTRNWCIRMAREKIRHCENPSLGLRILAGMREN